MLVAPAIRRTVCAFRGADRGDQFDGLWGVARVATGGMEASLPGRYAAALFELAEERREIETVERDLGALDAATTESADFRRLLTNPLVDRQAATAGAAAVAGALGLGALVANFLGVLARNRRLAQLAPSIAAFRRMAANWRGETQAEVTSARPLAPDQLDQMRQKLRARVGREVAVVERVDPAILGGLVVRIGSQMIDGSVRTKLNTLALALKG